MNKPKVSIIIPIFNSSKTIKETLNSVLNQTFNSWECIIVDDGSTDNSSNIVINFCKKNERFIFFSRPEEKTKGPSSCRNFGLEQAKGAYIIFLDSDDLLADYCLEGRVKAFNIYNECDFLVFKMERFLNTPIKHFKKTLENIQTKQSISSFLQLDAIWQVTSPIYKKDLLVKIKGFNENLLNYEDVELAIKAIFNTKDYRLFNNIDSFYRNDENYTKKYKTHAIAIKSINSFIALLNSIHEKVILKTTDNLKNIYSQDLIVAYKKVFLNYIKENVSEFKSQNNIVINFFNKNKYLTFKQYIIFFFTDNFIFRFYKIKGFGLYRLIKYLYQ